MKIHKDQYFNSLISTNVLKIPRYEFLSDVGDEWGMLGDIVVEISTGDFCWHNGITWTCVSGGGAGAITTLTSLGGISLVGNGIGPNLTITGLESSDGSVTITPTGNTIDLSVTGGVPLISQGLGQPVFNGIPNQILTINSFSNSALPSLGQVEDTIINDPVFNSNPLVDGNTVGTPLVNNITIHVNPSGNDDLDGLSVINAVQTIDRAFEIARFRNANQDVRILLSAGTFSMGSSTQHNWKIGSRGRMETIVNVQGTIQDIGISATIDTILPPTVDSLTVFSSNSYTFTTLDIGRLIQITNGGITREYLIGIVDTSVFPAVVTIASTDTFIQVGSSFRLFDRLSIIEYPETTRIQSDDTTIYLNSIIFAVGTPQTSQQVNIEFMATTFKWNNCEIKRDAQDVKISIIKSHWFVKEELYDISPPYLYNNHTGIFFNNDSLPASSFQIFIDNSAMELIHTVILRDYEFIPVDSNLSFISTTCFSTNSLIPISTCNLCILDRVKCVGISSLGVFRNECQLRRIHIDNLSIIPATTTFPIVTLDLCIGTLEDITSLIDTSFIYIKNSISYIKNVSITHLNTTTNIAMNIESSSVNMEFVEFINIRSSVLYIENSIVNIDCNNVTFVSNANTSNQIGISMFSFINSYVNIQCDQQVPFITQSTDINTIFDIEHSSLSFTGNTEFTSLTSLSIQHFIKGINNKVYIRFFNIQNCVIQNVIQLIHSSLEIDAIVVIGFKPTATTSIVNRIIDVNVGYVTIFEGFLQNVRENHIRLENVVFKIDALGIQDLFNDLFSFSSCIYVKGCSGTLYDIQIQYGTSTLVTNKVYGLYGISSTLYIEFPLNIRIAVEGFDVGYKFDSCRVFIDKTNASPNTHVDFLDCRDTLIDMINTDLQIGADDLAVFTPLVFRLLPVAGQAIVSKNSSLFYNSCSINCPQNNGIISENTVIYGKNSSINAITCIICKNSTVYLNEMDIGIIASVIGVSISGGILEIEKCTIQNTSTTGCELNSCKAIISSTIFNNNQIGIRARETMLTLLNTNNNGTPSIGPDIDLITNVTLYIQESGQSFPSDIIPKIDCAFSTLPFPIVRPTIPTSVYATNAGPVITNVNPEPNVIIIVR